MSQSPSTVEQFVLLSLYTSPRFDQRKTPLIKGAPKQFVRPLRHDPATSASALHIRKTLRWIWWIDGEGAEGDVLWKRQCRMRELLGRWGRGGVLQQPGLTLVGGEVVLKWCRVGPFLSYLCPPPERRCALVGPLSEQRPANHVQSRHNSHRRLGGDPPCSLPLSSASFFFPPLHSLFLISRCVSYIAVVIK